MEGAPQRWPWSHWTASDIARCKALVKVLAALLALCFLGGFVFRALEREAELERYSINRALYTEIVDSVDFEHCQQFEEVGFCRRHKELKDRFKAFFSGAGNSLQDLELWTWLGSAFFVFQLSCTLGYATQGSPATPGGQFAAILFGLVGLPLFGCALLLSSVWYLQAARRWSAPCVTVFGGRPEGRYELVRITFPALFSLWLGAAVVFALLEGWDYPRALYFCFMTITTVGIGDDVPSTFVSRILCVLYVFSALSLFTGVVGEYGKRYNTGDMSPLVSLVSGHEIGQGNHKSQVVARLCFSSVAILCLLGAWIFPILERQAELDRYDRSRAVYAELQSLAEFKGCERAELRGLEICRNRDWFGQHLRQFFGPNTVNSMVDQEQWKALGSASFVLSVASTVGYGSQNPATRLGKVAIVIFGLLAIPCFWYCMIVWSTELRSVVQHLVHKVAGGLVPADRRPTLALMLVGLGLWLTGGLVFTATEGWHILTSLYFCFVTLSAAGFVNVMPSTLAGRLLLLPYIALGLTTVSSLIGEMVSAVVYALGVHDDDDDEDPKGDQGRPQAPA